MGRSPYDPDPHYVHCGDCSAQYDDSGYYGEDPHVCAGRAEKRLRRLIQVFGPDKTRRMLNAVIDQIGAEERKRLAKEKADERARKAHKLEEAKETVRRLEEELKT